MSLKRAPPINLGLFDEIYNKSVTLEVEGPNHDRFGELPFD